MAGPKCSVCDLDASSVGTLETIQVEIERGGSLKKVSQSVCTHCKSFLNVSENDEG